MSDLTELLPEPALIEALRTPISTVEKAGVLARLRGRVEENRASLIEHTREFNEMYDRAGHELPVEGLVQLAERVRESEKSVAERLEPWIRALQQALPAPGQEGQQHIEELIEISVAWLAVYRDIRVRLLELAAERRGKSGNILWARPVEGEIDHADLTREIVARYPKILAALAK